MAFNFFGIKTWMEEKQKVALKKEIEKIINDNQAESNALLQDWDSTEQTRGRSPKVSYRTLESIYKRESWVRACVGAIQRAATSNGFKLVTKDKDDDRPLTRRETHKIMKLLRNPNPDDSFSDIIGNAVVDLEIFGDSYIEIVRDSKSGLPVALYNLNAPSIKILVNKHGTVLGYIQSVGQIGSGNKPIIFDAKDVVHFKLPNPGNAVYGLSPLESLSMPIETDLHAQSYNLNFFKNNAVPKLHVDLGQCTVAQLKRTREFFRLHFQGSGNAHKTLITEGNVKVSPIGVKPADMEFLEQRKFSRQEIASVYGVPPMKIGISEDVNRACFPENTLVSTPYGYKKIKDIKEGDTVYSYDNRHLVERFVENAFSKGKKKLYELRLNDRMVEATDNHPFLVVVPYKEKSKFGSVKVKTLYKLEWKQLKDIKKGDLIASIDKTQPVKNRRVFKHNIPLTEDFMELIGLYIGDGSITKNNQGKLSEISFAIEQDAEIREYYENIAKKIFKSHINKNKHVFRICSIKWGKIFEDLDLAHNVYSKRIPEWVWGLDDNLKMAFFRGLIESDGTVNKRGAISYSGCNEHLVKQIKLLAMDIGIPSSNIYKMKRNKNCSGFKTDKPLYRVTFENYKVNKTLKFRTSLYNERIQNNKNKHIDMYSSKEFNEAKKFVGDDFIVRRVKSIKYTREDIIYDLEVKDTHCFIAEGMVVHNSSLEADKTFKAETITPLQRMMANKLNLCVISLFNQSRVQLEFSELDLRDAKEQAEIDKIDIESGVRTVNEVRKERGLKPLDNPQPPKTESPKEPETQEEKPEDIEQNFDYLDEPLEKEIGNSERLYHFR